MILVLRLQDLENLNSLRLILMFEFGIDLVESRAPKQFKTHYDVGVELQGSEAPEEYKTHYYV